MDQRQFQPLMFSVESKNPAVRIVKEFLNAHPHVRNFNLPLNYNFDTQTQAALAEYQRYRKLSSIDGSMNAETWKAIGSDMHPAQIEIVSTHAAAVRWLLISGSDSGRGLSADEIKLAQSVFKSSINYNKVRVHKEKYIDYLFGYISQPDNTLMTPNGEIYASPNVYSSNYSSESDEHKCVFLHEMCHVWQWQRNIKNIKASAAKEMFRHKFVYDEAYFYDLSYTKNFEDYGIEQQASIIEDYCRVVKYGLNWNVAPNGKTRCQSPVTSRDHALSWVLDKFLRNPGYLGSNYKN